MNKRNLSNQGKRTKSKNNIVNKGSAEQRMISQLICGWVAMDEGVDPNFPRECGRKRRWPPEMTSRVLSGFYWDLGCSETAPSCSRMSQSGFTGISRILSSHSISFGSTRCCQDHSLSHWSPAGWKWLLSHLLLNCKIQQGWEWLNNPMGTESWNALGWSTWESEGVPVHDRGWDGMTLKSLPTQPFRDSGILPLCHPTDLNLCLSLGGFLSPLPLPHPPIILSSNLDDLGHENNWSPKFLNSDPSSVSYFPHQTS